MQLLKQSTAATILIGPVLDSTGAAYTSMVIGDFNITKNGTTAAMASAAAVTHSHNGMYLLDLTTGNTDTAGRITISSNKATYAMAPFRGSVLVATVFDALITNATTAAGGLGDIQRMAGTALTGRDIGASVLLSSGTGTGQVKLASGYIAPNWGDIGNPTTTVALTGTTVGVVTTVTNQLTAAAIATGVWQDTTAGDFTTASSIGKSLYTSGVVPGGSGGLLISGSNSGTTTLGALTVTGATTLTGAVSGTNASNDLRGILLQATQTGVTIPTVTTVTNQLTAAAIATGVWQDSTAGDFTTASSIGKCLYISNIAPGAAGGHFISGSNAGTTTVGALTVTGATTLTGAVSATNASNDIRGILLQATQSGVTIPTVTTVTNQLSSSTIAGAVWDLATSGHTNVGTFGAAMAAAGAAGDPWTTDLSTYTSGQAGFIVYTNLNATISSRSSHSAADVWASVTRTLTAGTNIQLPSNGLANITAWTVDITGSLSGSVGSVTTKTGYKLASDGLDSVLVESSIVAGASLTDDAATQLTSINARQALSLSLSALSGVLAGAAFTTVTIKPAGLPSGNTRITATVDADGNRSALTLKVPT